MDSVILSFTFVLQTELTIEFSTGISDGAGGNSMYGFDPRLFSESLMRNCSDLAHSGKYNTHEPKRLLGHAFDRLQTENCFGMFVILKIDRKNISRNILI